MTINYTITTLKRDLIRSFAVLDSWFDKDDDFLDFRPPDGDSVRDVFAHALTTGEALMKVIDAGGSHTRKSLHGIENAADYERILNLEEKNAMTLLATLFTGDRQLNSCKSLPEIRSELRDQLDRCLCHLELLRNGESALFDKDLDATDSIDFYQGIQLLSIALKQYAVALKAAENQFSDVRS